MPGLWRNLPYLLRRTVVSSARDGCFSIAKGAAYSSLLSFFPILTTSAAILVEVNAQFAVRQLTGFLSEILPPGTEQAVVNELRHRGGKPVSLLIVALLLATWAASSVVKSLIDGFHVAYRVPKERDFFHQTAIALAIVFAASIPFVAASVLLLFGQETERQLLHWFRVDPLLTEIAPIWEIAYRIARFAVAFFAATVLNVILYYVGPRRRQHIALVIPGAVLATVLWVGATLSFSWYVRNVSNYNVLYGSIGTGIALLVWMYLLSVITIIGCEFNAEYERMLSIESN